MKYTGRIYNAWTISGVSLWHWNKVKNFYQYMTANIFT